jgi:hypothetical protein
LEAEAAAAEHVAVGLVHGRVGVFEAGFVGVERVAVFHDEFATAHEAEAGADFVAEFGLDLVEVDGELAVGADEVADDGGDDFFVGGAEGLGAVLAIGEGEHDAFGLGVGVPATGFLPEFSGLELGEEAFEGSGGVHFFADDLGDFAQDAEHEGEVGVEAAAQATDVAGPQEQFVAWDFGFCGVFTQGDQQHLGQSHGGGVGKGMRKRGVWWFLGWLWGRMNHGSFYR